MLEIKKHVEMLEEAVRQVDKGTVTGARLALLLLDNLAEIAMYAKVRQVFAKDDYWHRSSFLTYPPKVRKSVLWGFNDKVDFFLSESPEIAGDQAKVLKAGHYFRREAYHRGTIRGPIIGEVARAYLEAVCSVVPRLWLGALLLTPGRDDAQAYLKQYEIDATMIDQSVLAAVFGQVAKARFVGIDELVNALSKDIAGRLETFRSGLSVLATGGYEQSTEAEVLKSLQFTPMFQEKYTFPQTDDGFQQSLSVYDKEWATYVAPITLDTLDQWEGGSVRIGKAALPGEALELYLDLEEQMVKIEECMSQAAYEFDERENM